MIIKYIKKNTYFLILLASWLIIVSSISAKPPIFFYKQSHIFENLESLRLTFAIIISFIFITISIHNLFKVGFATEKPPQSQVTIDSPTKGIAENRLVITVAPQ